MRLALMIKTTAATNRSALGMSRARSILFRVYGQVPINAVTAEVNLGAGNFTGFPTNRELRFICGRNRISLSYNSKWTTEQGLSAILAGLASLDELLDMPRAQSLPHSYTLFGRRYGQRLVE